MSHSPLLYSRSASTHHGELGWEKCGALLRPSTSPVRYKETASGTPKALEDATQTPGGTVCPVEETKVTERFTEHDLRAKVGSDAESLEHAKQLLAHSDSRLTERVYRRRPETIKLTR